MNIDTQKIYLALHSGTARSVSEKFGLSLQTVKRYRASKNTKSYMDWKGMSISTAERIMTIINEEEKNMKTKYYAILSEKSEDVSQVEDWNFEGLDLATTLDRSFDTEKEAVEWIKTVLAENVHFNFGYLVAVKEATDGISFDIVSAKEVTADAR